MKYQKPTIIISDPNNQQGATLIVVLLVLVLITLVGVIVVRNSSTDLRLATASQIDSLLFIAAEQPNAALEKEVDSPTTKIFSETDGMIGYFMSGINEAHSNHKLITCFRPQVDNPFNYNKLAVYTDKSTYATSTNRQDGNGESAFCLVGREKDYTSKRNASMAQMVVTQGAGTGGGVGDKTLRNVSLGTNLVNGKNKDYQINVEVSSALPAYSSSANAANECFDLSSGKSTEQCLTDKGVPNKAVSQNYIVQFQDNVENAT